MHNITGSNLYNDQTAGKRIAFLITQLAEAEAQLTLETNGEVDAVIDPRTHVPILLRKAQNALRTSEERYRQIVETTGEGIWVTDADFRTTYVNQRVVELLGRPVEDLMARPPSEFTDDYNVEKVRAATRFRRKGSHGRYDLCFRHVDGSEVWVMASVVALHNAAGDFTGSLALLSDISERKRAEDALRRSEEKMRDLLESLQDVVWSATPDGSELLYVSSACKAVYGCAAEEFIGNPRLWLDTVHPEDRPEIPSHVAELFRTGSVEHQFRILWPDNSVHWISNRAFVVRNEQGEIVRVDGIARDTTAHRAAEEEAVSLREQLHQTFKALPESFYLLDEELRFVYLNPAAEILLGYPSSDLIGKQINHLFPPDPQFDYVEAYRDILNGGGPLRFETHYKPLCRWLEIRAYRVPQGIAIHIRDTSAVREAARNKEAVLDGMAAHIALLDADGIIIEVNRAWRNFAEANGFSHSSAGVGSSYLAAARQANEDPEGLCRKLEQVIAGSLSRFEVEYSCNLADGTSTAWRMVASPAPGCSGRGGAVVVHYDISEARKVQSALAESEQRYSLAAEGANDGLFDWNLKTARLYLAPRWKEILGYSPDEIADNPHEWLSRIHPEEAEAVNLEMFRRRQSEHENFEHEFRLRHRNGSYRWVLCRAVVLSDPSGTPLRLVGSVSDVTDRKQYENMLAHDAMHDTLTGLANRPLIMERLDRAVERANGEENYRYAVLFIDLDNFKNVNDGLGHQVGDLLLIEIGRRLVSCLKSRDTVARLGGDEFAVLINGIGGDSAAVQVARRIHEKIKEPFCIDGRDINTAASIGIVVGNDTYTSSIEVLRDADTAMYRAKAAGRHHYVIFDNGMHAAALARLETENDLYRALEQEELEVYYQPIVNLETGRFKALEALVRWRHPTRGLVSPVEFISLAEETGQIIAIGEWVAREACRSLKRWHALAGTNSHPPLRMSINVSARQFSYADMAERFRGIVMETGMSPEYVNLELTETALLKNPAATQELLEALRGFGFHLHLDDFGTGYSSLSHLHQFPIDVVKIDRSFVKGMAIDSRNHELVRGIVNLAAGLGLDVIAEGVETEEQAAALHALNCRYAQGFLYSKPIPAADMERLLTAPGTGNGVFFRR